jgi:3,4-dihydroxy 2-butanone 4-phosphate synthase/GTP cyclohydrolase II
LNSTEEILEQLGLGRMAVMMDDEDRENEGDLLMLASLVRPEDINFMARYGRGLICLTLSRERCRQLRLPLMVAGNDSQNGTNFTVSIEAAEGVTTGISAYDRAQTVRVAVAPDARPEDLTQPGHIFPLMAQPGGVLTRAGHTEAGCDLARLAGYEPAAVIVEILNEDGSMARRPDLERFARTHGLKVGTIADLIRYRLTHEQTVERVADCDVDTDLGRFRLVSYQDLVDRRLHHVLARGSWDEHTPVLVRVHLPDTLRDLLGLQLADGGRPLHSALQRIASCEPGMLVLLGVGEDPKETIRRIRMLELGAAAGGERPEAASSGDLRTYGVGAQILRDLGVRRMRILGAPRRLLGLSGFGLDVVEYVS